MALEGQTPGKKAGIGVEGNNNKWMKLMESAFRYNQR